MSSAALSGPGLAIVASLFFACNPFPEDDGPDDSGIWVRIHNEFQHDGVPHDIALASFGSTFEWPTGLPPDQAEVILHDEAADWRDVGFGVETLTSDSWRMVFYYRPQGADGPWHGRVRYSVVELNGREMTRGDRYDVTLTGGQGYDVESWAISASEPAPVEASAAVFFGDEDSDPGQLAGAVTIHDGGVGGEHALLWGDGAGAALPDEEPIATWSDSAGVLTHSFAADTPRPAAALELLLTQGAGGAVAASAPLLDRATAWRNPLPQGGALNDIAVGAGRYVAVGPYGLIMSGPSPDALAAVSSGLSRGLTAVSFAAGTFVAIAPGVILTSADGESWTIHGTGDPQPVAAIEWLEGSWFVVGDGVILRSADAISWSRQVLDDGTGEDPAHQLRGITHGNGLFAAVSHNGGVLLSPDAETWLAVEADVGMVTDITFWQDHFVAVGHDISVSQDGVLWEQRLWHDWIFGVTNYDVEAVTTAGDSLVAVGGRGTAVTTADLDEWTKSELAFEDYPEALIYAEGELVTSGYYGTVHTSADGATWTQRTGGFTDSVEDVAFGGGRYVAVGARIFSSPDGASWTPEAADPDTTLTSVAYGAGTFVAASSWKYEQVHTSQDGAVWVQHGWPTSGKISDIAFGVGTFVAVGSNGQVLSSADGVDWQLVEAGTSEKLFGVAEGEGTWVAVGSDGTILSSPDVEVWTPRTSGVDVGLFGVAFGAGRFVATGDDGAMVTSPDGIDWSPAAPGTDLQLGEIAFGGGRFVALVKWEPYLLTSTDGLAWQRFFTGVHTWHNSLTYANDRFTIVGSGGAIVEMP